MTHPMTTKRIARLQSEAGIAQRIVDWFRSNPEEEMTASDLAIKFDVAEGRVRVLLVHAVDTGTLVYGKQRTKSGYLYEAGPNLHDAPMAAARAPAPRPPHVQPGGADLDNVQIENRTYTRPTSNGAKLAALCARLGPGQSFRVSAHHMSHLYKIVRQYRLDTGVVITCVRDGEQMIVSRYA